MKAATNKTPANQDVPRLAYRPDEAAAALGISERTLWTWTKAGIIAHVTIGKTTRYPVSALRKCLHQMAMANTAAKTAPEPKDTTCTSSK